MAVSKKNQKRKPEANVLQVLRGVRRLLSDEEHWTKGARARNKIGWSVDASAKDAHSWCMVGAVEKVSAKKGRPGKHANQLMTLVCDALAEVTCERHSFGIIGFNDIGATNHSEVLSVIDEAIQHEKERIGK